MARQHDRYERRSLPIPAPRKSSFGHWIPLVLTVTIATIGLAAWIWSERKGDEEEDGRPDKRPKGSIPPVDKDLRQSETGSSATVQPAGESSSYMTHISGAIKRNSSPQQIFDGASRTVAAGVAAAGAVVGRALSTIGEEDKNAYKDHKTWSEEAELKKAGTHTDVGLSSSKAQPQRGPPPSANTKRKIIAVVISADADGDGYDDGDEHHHEHASVLSYLPRNIDFSKIRLFVLIYAPFLKEHPLDANSSRPPASLSSSFSNISPDQVLTPGEEAEKPLTSATPGFDVLWSQAQMLVEKDTMILPFTTPSGHVHILRHLNPDMIYLQESLAGLNGDVIPQLQYWYRHDVILVVGADGGYGGLADSESEAEQVKKTVQWWEREERVGRGRGIIVVDSVRVGDDWARRIEGVE